jgi:Response regulator of the LytR/AlgR family
LVDSKTFFRVSRNFIVNVNAIQDVIAYSSNRLKVILLNRKEKEDIIVSRDRVTAFKNWMDR